MALELLLSVSSLPALLSPLRSERVVTMVHHTSSFVGATVLPFQNFRREVLVKKGEFFCFLPFHLDLVVVEYLGKSEYRTEKIGIISQPIIILGKGGWYSSTAVRR